ncbi:MAG: hypothetical protein KAQ94_08160 [Arcobacteraceae bacterium]|nr:hypothetical protein [Arcobacteraceae bacterium]
MKLFLSIILAVYIFTGCSSKQYFEPEETYDFDYSSTQISSEIATLNKDGATLEDFRIINKDGVSTYSLPEGYSFLNKVNSSVIASDKTGNLLINKKIINLGQNVVAASIKENLAALILSNNSIVLYDLTTQKFKLKEKLASSLLNDTKIANPIFLDDIAIFPTLNGKVILVSIDTNKIIKTINVDPSGQINNVIFLQVINDAMVVATPNKVLSIADNSFSIRDYEINDIISAANNLYLSTLDGKIIKLNLQLEEIVSRKFKFAKIYSLGFGTSLYALESQGYLINLGSDFSTTKVYDFDFDETSKTIAIGDTLYFDDEYIKLK